jgi:hypothetical protein
LSVFEEMKKSGWHLISGGKGCRSTKNI